MENNKGDRFKILMVEDDLELAEILAENLNRHGIDVVNYPLPSTALEALERGEFDGMILDLSLPEMDGLELLQKIRQFSPIPIIISSARGELEDKIEAFKREADDYLPKPYHIQELVWRLRRLIGRVRQKETKSPNRSQNEGDFFIGEGEILYRGEPLPLTFGEFQILSKLIKNRGRLIPKEELILGWESNLKSVEVLISRIRKKIPKECIETIRGIGYKFVCK